LCFLLIGVKAGITVIDCEARQAAQTTADDLKRGIARHQHRQKIIQFVNPWYGKSPYLQKGLEILLSGLLCPLTLPSPPRRGERVG